MAIVPPEGWLVPGTPQLLKGGDRFVSAATGSAAAVGTVADFWSWAFSDLRDNSLRGILAEFIVGTALDATAIRRKAWDNHDLLTPDGVRGMRVSAGGQRAGGTGSPTTSRSSIALKSSGLQV